MYTNRNKVCQLISPTPNVHAEQTRRMGRKIQERLLLGEDHLSIVCSVSSVRSRRTSVRIECLTHYTVIVARRLWAFMVGRPLRHTVL